MSMLPSEHGNDAFDSCPRLLKNAGENSRKIEDTFIHKYLADLLDITFESDGELDCEW